MSCPLCQISNGKNEEIFYSGGGWIICTTKDKKGHRERIMMVWRRHEMSVPAGEKVRGMKLLKIWGELLLGRDWVYLRDTLSSIKGHYHMVASDWEGWDVEQMKRSDIIQSRWVII